jgi:hypothetical protein
MHIFRCIFMHIYTLGNISESGDDNKNVVIKSKKRPKTIDVIEQCNDDNSVSSSLSGSLPNGK